MLFPLFSRLLLFLLSVAVSLVRFYSLRTGLGGGQRGACSVPPSSGQRTGNLDKVVCRHSLHRPNASMIKQKKIVGDFLFFCSMILAFSLCRLWRRTVCLVPPRVDSLLKRTSLSPTLMLADGWASSPEYLGQGSLRLSLIERGAVVPRPSNGHLCHFRQPVCHLLLPLPIPPTTRCRPGRTALCCLAPPFPPRRRYPRGR